MELRPPAGLGDQGAVGAGDAEVLHHALDVVVGAAGDGEVPGDRDADGAVGVVGDQRRVLESVDLAGRHPAVTRPVVHVDELGPGLARRESRGLRWWGRSHLGSRPHSGRPSSPSR